MSATFKALSALLCYPDEGLQAAMAEIRGLIAAEGRVAPPVLAELEDFCSFVEQTDLIDLQEHYVALFDKSRLLSLHLFEHVHGESRDRGQALVDLAALYEQGGLERINNELPDYLPLFLEYLSTRPLDEARLLLAETLHILAALEERLRARGSGYASLLRAIRSAAGDQSIHTATTVHLNTDLPAELDAQWAEPPVIFDPDATVCESGGATVTSVPLSAVPRRARQT
jgi:nitrate reductase delta subunit